MGIGIFTNERGNDELLYGDIFGIGRIDDNSMCRGNDGCSVFNEERR